MALIIIFPFPEMPSGWNSNTTETCRNKMTRTKLLEKRRKDFLPDPSFDVDGDGFVGNMDYFIAMRFDKDKDGKLSAEEKAACLKALKEDNYEEKFLFGLDANVPINENKDPELIKNRVIQIGDKLVRHEYYNVVDDKYQDLKNNTIVKCKTRSELLNNRRQEQRDQAEKEYTKMRDKQIALAEKFRPKTPVGHPGGRKIKASLLQQLQERQKRRLGNSLSLRPDCDFTNDDPEQEKKQQINLNYISNPVIKTRKELKELRGKVLKEENDQTFKQSGGYNHIDAPTRVQQNEDYRVGYQSHQTTLRNKEFRRRSLEMQDEPAAELVQTRTMLMKKRRQNEIKSNHKKFSAFAKGVHGYEIPNFSSGTTSRDKMYWQNHEAYCQNPGYQSQKHYLQDNKWWSKNDEMLLYDTTNEISKSTKQYVKQEKKDKVTDNALTKNFIDPNLKMKNKARFKTERRWTETERIARMKKGFVFEKPAIEVIADTGPLFSSFNLEQRFEEPYVLGKSEHVLSTQKSEKSQLRQKS